MASYNNIDLDNYRMTNEEQAKAQELINEIKEKIFDEEVNTFGLFDLRIVYINKMGYFALLTNNDGEYQLMNNFPTISKDIASMNVIFIATANQGFEYEHNYRDYLKDMWKEDYPNLSYDGRKYAYEYSLKKN